MDNNVTEKEQTEENSFFDEISRELVISDKQDQAVAIAEERLKQQAGEDENYAKDKLKELYEKGNEVLDDMIAISKEGDVKPSQFEVIATMIKTLGDTARGVMDLKEQKSRIKKNETDSTKGQIPSTQNNIIFNGNTSELLKMLGSEKKHGADDIIDAEFTEEVKE